MKWQFLAFLLWASAADAQLPQPTDSPVAPACNSYILNVDVKLTAKQQTCLWVQNELFSPTALAGAAFSASYSQISQLSSDQGKGTTGFATRFSESYAQGAAKNTAAYLTRFVLREDPRRLPPYVMDAPVTGFWRRTGKALAGNFTAFRCDGTCQGPDRRVHRVFALSRVTGAFADGYSSMLWAPDRLNDPGRALRGSATSYGFSFANAWFTEFKPEISRYAGKVVGKLFGGS
jgi:hypothetical protein